jgi:hypothetical protein
MGEGQHASAQKFLIRFLSDRETELAIKVAGAAGSNLGDPLSDSGSLCMSGKRAV